MVGHNFTHPSKTTRRPKNCDSDCKSEENQVGCHASGNVSGCTDSAVNNNNVMSLCWSHPKKSINPVMAGRRLHRAAETVWFNLFINSLTTKLTGWKQRVGLWKQLASYFQPRLDKKLLTGSPELFFCTSLDCVKSFVLMQKSGQKTTTQRQRWGSKSKPMNKQKKFTRLCHTQAAAESHLSAVLFLWWVQANSAIQNLDAT